MTARAIFLKSLVLSLSLACAASLAFGADGGKVKLAWSLMRMTGEGAVSESPSRKLSMASGSNFRFYYQAMSPQFLYIFLDDAGGNLTVVRPAQGASAKVDPGPPQYIPGSETWFTLDMNPGTETFHILVSDASLYKLDALLAKAKGGIVKGEDRAAVLDEITALKRTKSELNAPAEKPVPIAGTMRGSAAKALEAVEVSAERFYARTLKIEHQK